MVSWKVKRSQTALTTSVGWLLLLQLTVLNRSAIVVLPKFLMAFLCCHVSFCNFVFCVVTLLFGFFFGCRVFFHRTESDIFLFFSVIANPLTLFLVHHVCRAGNGLNWHIYHELWEISILSPYSNVHQWPKTKACCLTCAYICNISRAIDNALFWIRVHQNVSHK